MTLVEIPGPVDDRLTERRDPDRSRIPAAVIALSDRLLLM